MRKLLILAALLVFAACSSSGDDGSSDAKGNNNNGSCMETLPECETTVCVGNYVRTCSQDGRHYVYELCYGQTCKDGVCTGAACLEPDKTECKTLTEYELCLPNMTMVTTKECAAGTKCASGACVSEQCKAGDKACGWQTLLTCGDDGSWVAESCDAGEYCDEVSLGCVETDAFCADNPLGAYCQDLEVSVQCDTKGKVSSVKCGSKEVCVDGFCQPKACGVSYVAGSVADVVSDTGLTDTTKPREEELVTVDLGNIPEIPPLEKLPKANITLNGGDFEMWEVKFTSAKQANYVFKDQDLQISMAKGPYLMEVHFMGIEEGVVGSFSSEEPGSVNVLILFNDGSTDQEVVQWKWSSISFNATLDQFEGPGGWVKGTFSGTLEQAAEAGEGPPVDVLNGFFEVPRKE
jgi:hypothetical protein